MKAKDKLRAYWKDNDLWSWSPFGTGTIADAKLMLGVLDPLVKELEARGYDKSTIKFSIEPQKGNQRFRSERETQPPDGRGREE